MPFGAVYGVKLLIVIVVGVVLSAVVQVLIFPYIGSGLDWIEKKWNARKGDK